MSLAPMQAVLDDFIVRERLPASYLETVEQWYMPLLERLLHKVSESAGTYTIGVSGSQGSGKSTLAALLVLLLRESMGLRSVNLSLDDFYLTHEQRQSLAKVVHPLLATRGVPGTHDVNLAMQTMEALKTPGMVRIPQFNKAVDDRVSPEQWRQVSAPVDVIILEGWCLGIGPQSRQELKLPINSLEEGEDGDGIWRSYVNDKIAQEYLPLYQMVDYMLMLKAPNFKKVYEWRQRQEEKLAMSQADKVSNNRIMSESALKRFIQHYERVTRHGLETMPLQANEVFILTDEQSIARVQQNFG